MSAPILHLSILQKPVFLLNSCLDLFSATNLRWLPLSLSYGVNLPSSLTMLTLPFAWKFSFFLPVSVYGTSTYMLLSGFSCHLIYLLRYYFHSTLRYELFRHGSLRLLKCVPKYSIHISSAGIFYLLSIHYAFRPRVRSRLTLGGQAFPGNAGFRRHRFSLCSRYLFRHYSLVYCPLLFSVWLHPVHNAPLPSNISRIFNLAWYIV